MSDPPANRLARETSPYLLQHAHNPVDWFPWGEEALGRARDRDRPIFLSVGYAACHWCHVMERESFEDPGTAELLNTHYVSIKVDREERPDVDGVYMDAVQAMSGHGGWPMSVFLTPAGEPFFAGTYFPPEPGHGMPSFRQVLEGIADAWRDRRDELVSRGGIVTEAIRRSGAAAPTAEPSAELSTLAVARLSTTFDERWGGFGAAPKFPQPMTLEFLLGRAVQGTPGALEMVTTTLRRMAEGGIHDHLGGGFARYSTDEAWHVPHFEKMLYDNAQLLQLYTRAWQVTGDDDLRRVAEDTAAYLLREMRHPAGGFFSSQDADSEGEEGRFFTWTWADLVELVGEPVADYLGASPHGNWEGKNVLWRPESLASVAARHGMDEGTLRARLEDARSILFSVRERRVHPATDDKVLAAWNGLVIRALAEAGRALGEPALVDAATGCADFVFDELRDDAGRLTRSWRNGSAGGLGFADDHASLAMACLTLFETTFELRWFTRSRELADTLLHRFHDPEGGGFFQTADDAEPLVVRPGDPYDNATPGGNSAAAEIMLRMALLTGDATYEHAGAAALRAVGRAMGEAPTGFGHALQALDLYVGPSREVAIVGDPADPATHELVRVVTSVYRPNVVMAVAAADDLDAARVVPLLEARFAIDGRPTAYVCEGFSCRLPVTDPEALARQLDET